MASSVSSLSSSLSWLWAAPAETSRAAESGWHLKLPAWVSSLSPEIAITYAADWGASQVFKKSMLVSLNGPTTYIALWFGVTAARRGFLFAELVTKSAWSRIQSDLLRAVLLRAPTSVPLSGAAGGAADDAAVDDAPAHNPEVDPAVTSSVDPVVYGSAHSAPSDAAAPRVGAPAEPVTPGAWSTLRAIIKHAPSPNVSVHILGYACSIVFGCAGVYLWSDQRARTVASFVSACLPAAITSAAVVSSEYANRIENERLHTGDFERGSQGAYVSSRLSSFAASSFAAFAWLRGTSAAFSGLDTMWANVLAKAAESNAALLGVLGYKSAMVIADGWTEMPLKAAAIGVALFFVSFVSRKIDVHDTDAHTRNHGFFSEAGSLGGAANSVDSPRATTRKERMYSVILRILDS
jgi:hypothetical protein